MSSPTNENIPARRGTTGMCADSAGEPLLLPPDQITSPGLRSNNFLELCDLIIQRSTEYHFNEEEIARLAALDSTEARSALSERVVWRERAQGDFIRAGLILAGASKAILHWYKACEYHDIRYRLGGHFDDGAFLRFTYDWDPSHLWHVSHGAKRCRRWCLLQLAYLDVITEPAGRRPPLWIDGTWSIPIDFLLSYIPQKKMPPKNWWELLIEPTVTSAGGIPLPQPAEETVVLPDGEWLMPPVTLQILKARTGQPTTGKTKVLLNPHGLRNWPPGNRQSWTVNLAGMDKRLRADVDRRDD
jgi:hypothetical protein